MPKWKHEFKNIKECLTETNWYIAGQMKKEESGGKSMRCPKATESVLGETLRSEDK